MDRVRDSDFVLLSGRDGRVDHDCRERKNKGESSESVAAESEDDCRVGSVTD